MIAKTFTVVFVAVFLTACALQPNAVGPALSSVEAASLYTASGYQASYLWIKQNVFKVCNYCHPNSKANMFTYDGIRKLVVPGHPEQSLLYQKVYTGQMPPGGVHLKKADVQVIYDWIQQGAMNN